MAKADIGLIGLGVMGENLVLNMADHGYTVAVYNRTTSKVDEFINNGAAGKSVIGTHSLEDLVKNLESPRRIMLMVKAGRAIDAVSEQLLPLLDKGDIIIDGGNSYFPDTVRRTRDLGEKGILFMGVGVSGGEEGARNGPSIMPGGAQEGWPHLKSIYQDIAAKADGGEPCCEWVGSDGAGHFVKMVHNGIEYSDMQLICEAYAIMKNVMGLSPAELSEIFEEWNEGDLDSYLIEITSEILKVTDPETGKPLVDMILDTAGQKGTGKWTSQVALDLGVPAATIAEGVFARTISAIKEERVAASEVLKGPDAKFDGDPAAFKEDIRQALYASKVCCYAQGFALMKAASQEYGWDLKFGEIALMWRNGCIIRARFLNHIKDAYDRQPGLANLLLNPYFKDVIHNGQASWRNVVATASRIGIPVPAFSSALAYYDSYRTATLPANLLQAQRDYFGAHTFERVDRPRGEFFHHEWAG